MRMYDGASSAELRSLGCVDFFFLLSRLLFFFSNTLRRDKPTRANVVSPWIGRASKGIRSTVLDDGMLSGVKPPNFFTWWLIHFQRLLFWRDLPSALSLKALQILDWASFHHNLKTKSDATIDSSLIHPHLLKAAAAAGAALYKNLCHICIYWWSPAITCQRDVLLLCGPLFRKLVSQTKGSRELHSLWQRQHLSALFLSPTKLVEGQTRPRWRAVNTGLNMIPTAL